MPAAARHGRQPRILITGATGFIGRGLTEHLRAYSPAGTRFQSSHGLPPGQIATVDLRVEAEVAALIGQVRPTTVFHFAALTSPRRNDLHPSLAEESHTGVTGNLVRALPEETHVVFLSTDKVFDGTVACPDEETPPRPCCLYGRLKHDCERMIRARFERHHILRLPIVHADGDRAAGSFVDTALADLRDGRSVQAYDNVARCFVRWQQLITFLGGLLDDVHYGTYHLGSPLTSYYERVSRLCSEQGLASEAVIATSGDVTPAVQDLNTAKAARVFGRTFS